MLPFFIPKGFRLKTITPLIFQDQPSLTKSQIITGAFLKGRKYADIILTQD